MNSLSRIAGIFGVILLLAGTVGCETMEPSTAASGQPKGAAPAGGKNAPSQSPDLLRAGDKITVIYSDLSSVVIPPHEQSIREDGMITPPYVGEFKAAGLKRGELEAQLKQLYMPKYFKRINITVKIEERVFFVDGEVRNPSRQVYQGEMTVLKAINAAGGFTDFSKRSGVRIIRADKRVETVDCLKAQKRPSYDVPIYPGDQITVPRRFLFN